MAGKFEWHKFSEVNIDDPFFDSLKSDYEEFPVWFKKKSDTGERTLVFNDDRGVGSFVYIKEENESIILRDKTLPAIPRIKIGTFRLAERFRRQRLGEGALGVTLWKWQELKCEEIYVTVFEKHTELINLFERFGFNCTGMNERGECVYLRSRKSVDYSDPFKSFPFIRRNFEKAGMIPVEDRFHDSLFPYSELKGNKNEIEEETAGNGVIKVYIGSPSSPMHHKVGEPIIIYRKYTGTEGRAGFKSVATSFCTIASMITIKSANRPLMGVDEFIRLAGNKTIFDEGALKSIYIKKGNIVLLELLYNGYFGKGHNVNFNTLKQAGLFEDYPYNIQYSPVEFSSILGMGDVDVQNVIID